MSLVNSFRQKRSSQGRQSPEAIARCALPFGIGVNLKSSRLKSSQPCHRTVVAGWR